EESEIERLLPSVFRKLDWLEKEDIIKRVVSLEFNRLIDYYRDAQEIEAPSDRYSSRDDKGQRGRGRGDRFESRGNGGSRTAEKGYSRLFINLGRMDNVNPATLMGLINDFVPGKVRIGRIDLMQNFSFFEVPEGDSSKVISGLKGQEQNGRRISVEVAQGGAPAERRDRGRSRSGSGFSGRSSSRSDGDSYNSGKKDHRKGQRRPKYS
ncbi:DbpA RNA binding domain-containing protein, partial [Dysgonomonas sp. OttesenSCG-928-M03]|nr:DbpA RNA binding domain-containing protein [Dysgonomonas sp. OttesenSCG-928-M03]